MRCPTILLAVLLALSAAPVSAQPDGFLSLFDGRSLDGWRASENPGSFRLADGVLVVHGPRAHLFYEGPIAESAFENFELMVRAKTSAGANSGFFFHTRYQAEGWPAHGYEVQINTTHGDRIKTGSLYGVVNVEEPRSKDGEWFDLRVLVRGRSVIVQVDGTTVVDWTEPRGVTGTRRLSRGTFAIQAHDPESVVHIASVQVKPLPPGDGAISRAERYQRRKGDWWQRMDYGPFHTSTVDVDGKGNYALKGVTLHLDADHSAGLTFDTDLLRVAALFEGDLTLRGVTYDGSHGPQPTIGGSLILSTRPAPGTSHAGTFEDPRPIPSGPIPRDWGRYLGIHRHGNDSVLAYEIGGARILELPEVEWPAGRLAVTRTFEIQPADRPIDLVLADVPSSDSSVTPDGRGATVAARTSSQWPPKGSEVVVVADRTEGPWSELAMSGPSAKDALTAGDSASARFVGAAKAHPRAGATEGGSLPRINDGVGASNHDDVARSAWYDGPGGRLLLDLGRVRSVTRVDTYTWHRSNRAPQKYTLLGGGADADPEAKRPQDGKFRVLAKVDTTGLGEGGKHGSSVLRPSGELGEFRYLMLVATSVSQDEGMFVSEIDVFSKDQPAPALREPKVSASDVRPLRVRCVDGEADVRMHSVAVAGTPLSRLVLTIPPGKAARRIRVAFSRVFADAEAWQSAEFPAVRDLAPLTQGGPSLWPQELAVKGSLGSGGGAYVVDDVPIPFENPWGSEMRVGAFDFFPDGDRAALSTWNGDVWVCTGLTGDLTNVRWKRFATGLFETLGVRVVDGLVHVNGKDQITRLHDLDRDGEADFYECFDNSVYTTENFHEFTFDLQTDAEGNFYVSKGAPVRPGGRGFTRLIPHHGTVMKISRDGSRREVYSTGLRAPNGIGVSPEGQVTSGDNEGTWVPHCKLHWLRPGSFQGVRDVAHAGQDTSRYELPLCWFPMEVDNSSGGQTWVTSDQWGPFQGDLLHLSYGTSSIYKVMKEEVDGQVQGGVFRIPVRLGSSAMRARFHPIDGQLWVCGLRGWQTNASRLSAFQRVRHTKVAAVMPKDLGATTEGLVLTFTGPLDRETAEDPGSYQVEQWNYVWGPQYGSPELSAAQPDLELERKAQGQEMQAIKNHDQLEITGVELSKDGRSVFLRIPKIQPVMQMHIKANLEDTNGNEVPYDIYNTIHRLASRAR